MASHKKMANVTVYIPKAKSSEANQDLSSLGAGWDQTFGVALSADGKSPATHLFCNFGEMADSHLPGLMSLYGAASTDELIANVEARYEGARVFVGVPQADSMDEMGLQRIDSDI